MSDLFGNHIVGFPTRRLIYIYSKIGDVHGPGSFRPWVVSPVSRFARESFRPGSFRPGSFRPWVVSPLFSESFRPYFSTMPKSVIWCIICYFVLG